MILDPRPESVPWRADFGPAGLLRMSQPTLQRDRQGVDYGEEQNVQKLHAAIRHEQRDGLVTIKPFSLRMLVIWGIIFFFAGFFSGPPRRRLYRHERGSGQPAGSPVDSAGCSNGHCFCQRRPEHGRRRQRAVGRACGNEKHEIFSRDN